MAGRHLEGKVAIVTGGAGGIGTQICTEFARQGARVIVADTGADVEGRMGVDPARVNGVVDTIKSAGGEAISSIGDIADMDYAESVIRLALDTQGPDDLRAALAARPAQFAQTVTEQLMTYALGRPVDYRDMPVVRQIVRNAAREDYRFASLVSQIVATDAFRRRDAAGVR